MANNNLYYKELVSCRRSFHSDRDLGVFQGKWLPSRFSVDGVDGATSDYMERRRNRRRKESYDDIQSGGSIYTKSNRRRLEEEKEESCRSPGGVVGRLMGLDPLPGFEPMESKPEAWLEEEELAAKANDERNSNELYVLDRQVEFLIGDKKQHLFVKAMRHPRAVEVVANHHADFNQPSLDSEKKARQTEEAGGDRRTPSRIIVLQPVSSSQKNIQKSRQNKESRSTTFAKEIAKQIVKQVQEDVWKKCSTLSRINTRKSLHEASNTAAGGDDDDDANTASKRVVSHSYRGWSLPNSPRFFNRKHESVTVKENEETLPNSPCFFNRKHESVTVKKNKENHQILHSKPTVVGDRLDNDYVSNHPNSSLRKMNWMDTESSSSKSERFSSSIAPPSLLPNSPHFNHNYESITVKKNEEYHQILCSKLTVVGDRLDNDSVSNHPNSSLRKMNWLDTEPLSSKSERFSSSITPPSLLSNSPRLNHNYESITMKKNEENHQILHNKLTVVGNRFDNDSVSNHPNSSLRRINWLDTESLSSESERFSSSITPPSLLPNSPRFNHDYESITVKKNEENHQILHSKLTVVGNRLDNDSVSNHPNSSLKKMNWLDTEALSSKSERFSRSIIPPSLLRSLSVLANGQFTVDGQQGHRGQGSERIIAPAETKTTSVGSIFNRKIFLSLRSTLSLPRKKGTKNQKPKLYTSQAEIPEIIDAKKSIPKTRSPKNSSRKSNNTSANPSINTATTTGFRNAASLVSPNLSRFFKRLHNFRHSDDLSRNPISHCNRRDASTMDSCTSKSNNNVAKYEQPSPVSVLAKELFLEDSPSPSKPFCYNYDDKSKFCDSRYNGKAHNGDEIFLSILSIPSLSESTKEHRTSPGYGANEALQSLLDLFMFDDLSFPINRTAEMAYLRDILVFSGLSKSNSVELCCFSCHHGLDPSLFETMEEFYKDMLTKKEKTLWRPEGSSYRRLLFDMVDEYFLNGVAKPSEDYGYPWMNNCQHSYLFTGQKLLGNLWSHLSSALDTTTSDQEREEDIDSDLFKIDTSWAPTENELSGVLLNIEKLIFKDLIEEFLILRTL